MWWNSDFRWAFTEAFLKDGTAKFCGSHDDRSDYRYGVVFYENLEEAERSFLSYALHPTIIETHQACVEQKSTLYSLMPGEPGINWLSYEVKEPGREKQLRILKSLSVGKFVQRYWSHWPKRRHISPFGLISVIKNSLYFLEHSLRKCIGCITLEVSCGTKEVASNYF